MSDDQPAAAAAEPASAADPASAPVSASAAETVPTLDVNQAADVKLAELAAVAAPAGNSEAGGRPRKGPLSFLSGAITSALFAWGSLLLSGRVVAYYGAHPPHYSARMAQSIATAVKTLVVGMTFLATFTFAFVGLGLFLVFVRSLFRPGSEEPT